VIGGSTKLTVDFWDEMAQTFEIGTSLIPQILDDFAKPYYKCFLGARSTYGLPML